MTGEWEDRWRPLVEAVGARDTAPPTVAPDAVEASTIRRFLEPFELDCPIHYDLEAARRYGYRDVVAPGLGVIAHVVPPVWRPGGQSCFDWSRRDSGHVHVPPATGLEPPYEKRFATDFAIEFFEPAVVGDRLTWNPSRLVSCTPKETRVGRGAFVRWESEIVNQRDELVARIELELFLYDPWPSSVKDA